MSAIPWERYFKMTEDGRHIVPEAYEVLESLLQTRGLYQFGYNSATLQSGIGIRRSADVWDVEEALEEIMPFRKCDEGELCSIVIYTNRKDCCHSLMLSRDLQYVVLRKSVFSSAVLNLQMPSLEYALNFIKIVPEEYWDEETELTLLFPDILKVEKDFKGNLNVVRVIKRTWALEEVQAENERLPERWRHERHDSN